MSVGVCWVKLMLLVSVVYSFNFCFFVVNSDHSVKCWFRLLVFRWLVISFGVLVKFWLLGGGVFFILLILGMLFLVFVIIRFKWLLVCMVNVFMIGMIYLNISFGFVRYEGGIGKLLFFIGCKNSMLFSV